MIKNYYTAAHLQDELKKQLLSEEAVKFGTFVQPTSGFFNFQDNKELEFQVFSVFKNLDLNVLEKIKNFPKTTQIFIDFVKNLKLYHITPESLPQNTLIEKDIHQMTNSIFHLVSDPIKLRKSDLVVKDGLRHSEYVFAQKNVMSIDKKQKLDSVRFFFAQNKRQEIEAALQDVSLKELEAVAFVVPNKKEYVPIIESVIKRFGINTSLQNREPLAIKQQYTALIDFLFKQNSSNFDKLLKTNALNLKNITLYIKYLEHFERSYDNLPSKLDLARDEKHSIYTIQNKLSEDHQKILDFLSGIKIQSYSEIHTLAYKTLHEIYGSKIADIKDYLETYHNYLESDKHELIKAHFETINFKETKHDSFKIFDYNHLPLNYDGDIYFLGLTAQNFPAVTQNSGIIDDNFLSRIASYPTQQERIQYELMQKRKLYTLGSKQTFSYYISNYEGKPLECAYEIKAYCNKQEVQAKPWPLVSIRQEKESHNTVDPNLAKQLFMHDNILYASVSSLQRYVSEPHSYFFEYGLKVREPQDTKFNPLVLGNLNHQIVEENDLSHAWERTYLSYPKLSKRIDVIRRKNDAMMFSNALLLKDARANTKLEPTLFEEEIISNAIHPSIHLKGFIDRIDFSDNFFSIVDYKSSPTNLSLNSLIEARQLQLISYAAILNKQINKQALAIMYYSFSNPSNLNLKIYDYKVGSGIQKVNADLEKEFLKEKRYSAWFFNEVDQYFDTSDYWKGLSESKEGLKANHYGKYNFDGLVAILKNRYDVLYTAISDGIFDEYEIEKRLKIDDSLEEEWKGMAKK